MNKRVASRSAWPQIFYIGGSYWPCASVPLSDTYARTHVQTCTNDTTSESGGLDATNVEQNGSGKQASAGKRITRPCVSRGSLTTAVPNDRVVPLARLFHPSFFRPPSSTGTESVTAIAGKSPAIPTSVYLYLLRRILFLLSANSVRWFLGIPEEIPRRDSSRSLTLSL